jgi:hypothetical protein
MTFARRVFNIAGVYGLVVLTPLYFLEARIASDQPPAITHPEYYYGFIGVALAWQLAFLVIARDPLRYRMFMIPAILEKALYVVAVLVLFQSGRVRAVVLAPALGDLVWGVLFTIAYARSR